MTVNLLASNNLVLFFAFVIPGFISMKTYGLFFPHPIAKPWDYIFKQQDPFWVIIELKDGTKVGGLYSENSFSSNAPAEEQIYLEETWKLNENGGFDKKKQSTKGIIVSASEMKHIEFFELNFE